MKPNDNPREITIRRLSAYRGRTRNQMRAVWAGRALKAFHVASNADALDPRSGLVDLLTDLRHWAAGQGIDFDKAAKIAALHYSEEN
jgi:hypothetical protein